MQQYIRKNYLLIKIIASFQEELSKSVEKATLDGAVAAAAVRTAQHKEQQQTAYEAAAPAASAAAGPSGFVRAPVVIPVANTRAQQAGK